MIIVYINFIYQKLFQITFEMFVQGLNNKLKQIFNHSDVISEDRYFCRTKRCDQI